MRPKGASFFGLIGVFDNLRVLGLYTMGLSILNLFQDLSEEIDKKGLR